MRPGPLVWLSEFTIFKKATGSAVGVGMGRDHCAAVGTCVREGPWALKLASTPAVGQDMPSPPGKPAVAGGCELQVQAGQGQRGCEGLMGQEAVQRGLQGVGGDNGRGEEQACQWGPRGEPEDQGYGVRWGSQI